MCALFRPNPLWRRCARRYLKREGIVRTRNDINFVVARYSCTNVGPAPARRTPGRAEGPGESGGSAGAERGTPDRARGRALSTKLVVVTIVSPTRDGGGRGRQTTHARQCTYIRYDIQLYAHPTSRVHTASTFSTFQHAVRSLSSPLCSMLSPGRVRRCGF